MGWEPIAVIEGGVISYVRADHIGRPVFATNSAGVKVWSAVYTPFGGVHTSTGVLPNARFPGQWFQTENGLHQNWMRDYDPTTGRYIQADPLGLVDGASVYGYALQNPGRWIDPRGESAAEVFIGSAIAGVEWGAAIAGAGIVAVLGITIYPSTLGDGTITPEFAKKQEKAKRAEQAVERKAYKKLCSAPPPKTGDVCVDLKAKIDWQKQCLAARKAYGDKYYGDQSHAVENSNLQKGIDRMQRDLEMLCSGICP